MAISSKLCEIAYMTESQYPPAVARGFEKVLPEVHDGIFLPESALPCLPTGMSAKKVEGLADDNRSLLVPSMRAKLTPLEYYLEIKGIGARSPMYGFSSIDFMGGAGSIKDHWGQKAYGKPAFTGETWFGFSPYGAQGEAACVDSLKLSEMAADLGRAQNLNGFWFCPVISYCRLPDWLVREFSGNYWYRKYRGPWFQQKRLMPSDVRLYFHSDVTMGTNPQKVFRLFGLDTAEAVGDFINNFIASGIAALTLGARTVKRYGGGYSLLDYDDVWLDKDSVIAPNGLIHFADIDDIEWMPYPDPDSVRAKISKQFDRNHFEFMFGLDCLLSELDRMTGRLPGIGERRRELASRMELAVMGDRFVRAEVRGDGLDLVLRPLEPGIGELAIPVVDFQGKVKT